MCLTINTNFKNKIRELIKVRSIQSNDSAMKTSQKFMIGICVTIGREYVNPLSCLHEKGERKV